MRGAYGLEVRTGDPSNACEGLKGPLTAALREGGAAACGSEREGAKQREGAFDCSSGERKRGGWPVIDSGGGGAGL